jgi:xylulose-5-phosphate/fructose-6-phosphate phosphoketolase
MALTDDDFRRMHAYWRAALYLCVGMIYLKDNPLLREPLDIGQVKKRLLGHWGTDPGQAFVWLHLNRLIKEQDLDMIYVSGPGHGAPAVLANAYLEGTYSEVYPDKSMDEEGMRRLFREFSFPGGLGSHCTPETPGSINEGGELGYSLSHAYGAAFDNPDLIVAVVVGDGEAETGALATSWHSNKFLNPARDGAVLPILHLNGYKIANPTIFGRMAHEDLEMLFRGYGYHPFFVEGDDPATMHRLMADTLDKVLAEIQSVQKSARSGPKPGPREEAGKAGPFSKGQAGMPAWPMVILRTPKGWTGPREVDGHKVEGSWRSHQVPLDVHKNPAHLGLLEEWMRSYRPEELFDEKGALKPELRELPPKGNRRMSANPHTNAGAVNQGLRLPDFRGYAVDVKHHGGDFTENTRVLAAFLADIMRKNETCFRVFGPDETASNRLDAIYEATQKTWELLMIPQDEDGGFLSPDGRVMEMLSEQTLEGWLEGYVLTGRSGLFSSYEAFIHVIDSMFNQHAKWLEKSRGVAWRMPIPSLNILVTSTVWRQDHNGFSHQDPGFLDLVTNKSASITRIYLPPDANCLLSVTDHCFRSMGYVNVVVADKQPHLQYLTMNEAVDHCSKGIGMWEWASNDQGSEPDVVLACAGDIPTMEALAATALLREHIPDILIRFVNVVDLFKLQPASEHGHGLSDRDFDSLFTLDRPIIFNFHGYPWLIHKLAYRRTNHKNLHVRGYKEQGNINTPLDLAMRNQIDRFNLAIDVIDRVPRLTVTQAHFKDWLKNQIIENTNYAYENGVDRAETTNWRWPFGEAQRD